MPAKKGPPANPRSDYEPASDVTVIRADGSVTVLPPYSPEEHAAVVGRRSPRKRGTGKKKTPPRPEGPRQDDAGKTVEPGDAA